MERTFIYQKAKIKEQEAQEIFGSTPEVHWTCPSLNKLKLLMHHG